jgi:hypothetical protein
MNSTEDQLSLLSRTIATHAREVAGKEWKDEHRPVLLSILAHAGLGNLDEEMLTLQDKEVPIKSIVTALHEQFLAALLPNSSKRGSCSSSADGRRGAAMSRLSADIGTGIKTFPSCKH